MKLFQLLYTSDPYEPRGTSAVCTSIESLKAIAAAKGLTQVWQHVETHVERTVPAQGSFDSQGLVIDARSWQQWRDIMTGEIRQWRYGDFGPGDTCEEIESDTLL